MFGLAKFGLAKFGLAKFGLVILRTILPAAFLAVAALSGSGGPAMAQGNCEAITSPFAYNECLARQSPQSRRSVSPRRRGAGDPEASVRTNRRARYNPAPADGGPGVTITRGRNRTSATIDPWSSIKRTFAPSRSRRR
jgi:hypothetical protein